eukprot:2714715-Amphidinium_carterae.1
MDASGKAFYTRSLRRLTPELQWDKKVFDEIVIPQLETSVNKDNVEEEHIGNTIIHEFFTKTRLNEKRSAHRLYNNNKEQRQLPPDLDNADLQPTEHPEQPEDILPPPGLEQPPPVDTYIHPTPKAMAKPDAYKPTHRLTSNPLQSWDSSTIPWTLRSSPWRKMRTRLRRGTWRQS